MKRQGIGEGLFKIIGVLQNFKIASIWKRMEVWCLLREEQFKIIGTLLFKGHQGSAHGQCREI